MLDVGVRDRISRHPKLTALVAFVLVVCAAYLACAAWFGWTMQHSSL